MYLTRIILVLSTVLAIGCGQGDAGNREGEGTPGRYDFVIVSLDDEANPDSPEIGFRAGDYRHEYFRGGSIEAADKEMFLYTVRFYADDQDTIILPRLDLSEFIPTIPAAVHEDAYLSYIACINQEWNRNQVSFGLGEFRSSDSRIIRVDLARNCLNAYLWEVIVYVEEQGKILPYSHGWFDFPPALYANLFEQKNNIPFDAYKQPLEHWGDPENKKVNLAVLRTVVDTLVVTYNDRSDQMYPVAGDRLKKFNKIIYPVEFASMRDLQSDATMFATFTPPGIYDKSDSRKTQLGRFYTLEKLQLHRVLCPSVMDTLHEVELLYRHRDNNIRTRLIIGGLDLDQFPSLPELDANDGWENSMGIGNHPFIETYAAHLAIQSGYNPYYSFLLDEEGRWLDSHHVGIDGPLFHFSDFQRKTLHLWLLSFERHALIGHYVIALHPPD